MLKPAEISDSENIEDSEAPKDKSKAGAEPPKEGEAEKPPADDKIADKDDKLVDQEKDKIEEPKLMEDEGLLNFAAFPHQLKAQDKTKSDIELERKREE